MEEWFHSRWERSLGIMWFLQQWELWENYNVFRHVPLSIHIIVVWITFPKEICANLMIPFQIIGPCGIFYCQLLLFVLLKSFIQSFHF